MITAGGQYIGMSDYISRDQARNALIGFERYTGIDELPVEYAESVIRRLPGIDIVRCGECKYAHETPNGGNTCELYDEIYFTPDFFCAAGIRK